MNDCAKLTFSMNCVGEAVLLHMVRKFAQVLRFLVVIQGLNAERETIVVLTEQPNSRASQYFDSMNPINITYNLDRPSYVTFHLWELY